MKAIIFSFLVVIASCTELDDIAYDQFTLYKKFQYSGQIKTEGEYWAFDTINKSYENVFLYRDGSFFKSGSDIQDLIVSCSPINENLRKVGWWWGFYDINGSDMFFQTVDAPSINGHSKYQVFNFKGEFINDSSFSIKYLNTKTNETKTNIFRFRYCESKPDSMNVILQNIGR